MKLGSVHDNLFRYAMRHTEVAQAFIRHYLPTELSEQFDLSTLKIHKDTFIDPELQEFFADTLYEASLVDGSRGGFYFLFEHKSFAKRQTVFDLLGYMVRIWQQQAQQKSKYQQLKLKPRLRFLRRCQLCSIMAQRDGRKSEALVSCLMSGCPKNSSASCPITTMCYAT